MGLQSCHAVCSFAVNVLSVLSCVYCKSFPFSLGICPFPESHSFFLLFFPFILVLRPPKAFSLSLSHSFKSESG